MAAWARGRSQRRRVRRAPPRASRGRATPRRRRGAARRAESAPGLGVRELACGGPSPSIPRSPDHSSSPRDRVPEATVPFLAVEEKAARGSRPLLAAGPRAGTEGRLCQAEGQAQLTNSSVCFVCSLDPRALGALFPGSVNLCGQSPHFFETNAGCSEHPSLHYPGPWYDPKAKIVQGGPCGRG